ncbi:MAG: glycosyltransferase family 2 protein [Candidatus Caldarchaeum sp.]|nr:glycosyltransferase family 2 protein [Candidatus Caldarchaeum sp.]MCS7137399.1 glycosyltransferase family 2 protein [Candidatus Caldarchaeum sp.]MDW8359976.1 glycosyltransferase family 2 protein [Candidatus Caldarchaeum sp.]
MEELPKVSLIVLNHDSLKKLGHRTFDYMKSILETDYPRLEIILVDNDSHDGSERQLAEKFNQIKLVKLGENRGYAGGNNAGAKASSEDVKYLAFLNNDVVVEKNWLREIIQAMEKDKSIGAAQPKIMQLRNPKLIDSLGGVIDRTGRAYDLGHGLPDFTNVKHPYQVFYARGAAIVIRKHLFMKLGGFDEDYFIYFEETDLCWRLRLLAYKIITVPSSVIYHLGGGTTGTPSGWIIFLRRRNQLTTLLKNYSASNMVRYGSQLALLYVFYSLLRLIRHRDLQVSKSAFSAVVWNLRNMRTVFRKRALVQAMRRVPDQELMKFILARERYEQLTSYLPRTY